MRGRLSELARTTLARVPRALALLVVLAAPLAWIFRGVFRGRTYAETWYCAFDPIFAAARHFPTPQRYRDGIMDVSPSIIVRVADVFASASWRRFELPLWDPHDALGTPLHAQLHQMVLSPLRMAIVFATGADDVAATAFCLVQILLGAIGVYLWLRSTRVSTVPALAAAVGFVMMGGVLWGFRFSDLPASMLAPWLLWRAERLVVRPSLANALAVGLTAALIAFSAHPVVAFLAILAGAVYLLVRFAQVARESTPRESRQLTAWLGVAGAHAVATAAGAWVPFLELSSRGWNYKSESPVEILLQGPFELFFPWHGRYIVPAALLPLAVAGLWFPGRVRAASAALTLLGLGLTFDFGPLSAIRTLPFFSFVLPGYTTFLIALGLCGLAVGLFEGRERETWRVVLAIACVVAVSIVFMRPALVFHIPRAIEERDQARTAAALAGACVAVLAVTVRLARRRAYWVGGLALCALLGDSFHWAERHITAEPAFAPQSTPALAFLRSHTRRGERVVGVGLDADPAPHLPNTALATGLDDVRSTQPVFVGRSHGLLSRITGWHGYPTWLLYTGETRPLVGVDTVGLDLVGVRWVISRAGTPERHGLRRAYRDAYVEIDESTTAFPRAFLVHAAVVANSTAEAYRAMARVPLRDVVVLERATARVGATPPARRVAGEWVRLRRHAPREVVIDLVATRPGYLVLSDSFYPGWSATVDGVSAPILRADVALRAVWVGPGRHVVEFRYDPPLVLGALCLTLFGVLAWAGATLRTVIRARRTPGIRAHPRG